MHNPTGTYYVSLKSASSLTLRSSQRLDNDYIIILINIAVVLRLIMLFTHQAFGRRFFFLLALILVLWNLESKIYSSFESYLANAISLPFSTCILLQSNSNEKPIYTLQQCRFVFQCRSQHTRLRKSKCDIESHYIMRQGRTTFFTVWQDTNNWVKPLSAC